MDTSHDSFLNWPHQVPSSVLHCLTDANFIQALELGPPQWWQNWQKRRLAELLAWSSQLTAWKQWLPLKPFDRALNKLPLMRREDFRALVDSHEARVPAQHGALTAFQSSGSAGVPVNFWRSELATRINISHYWEDHRRQGRDLSRTMAVITGSPGAHAGSHQTVPGDIWLHSGLQLARNAPQFSLQEHAIWLSRHKPQYLVTTPATLSGVLSIIEMENLSVPPVMQVLTSSHTVEPELRSRARRVLGASIRDRYSCEELGPIAFQCPHSDEFYHVAVGNVIVEVVDPKGQPMQDGACGTVLVTGLHQWASPAIRYDLGDIAAMHVNCPACGATVPAISNLLGRKYFLMNSKSVGPKHIRILAEHWLACAPVREHRLIQTSATHFQVELVLTTPITATQRQSIQSMLTRLIGTEFSFELIELATIEWPQGGKRQEFIGWMP